MAVSGSTSYSLVANQLIEKAFHRLGKASEGEPISPRMYSDGLWSLNLLIKSKLQTTDRLFLRTEVAQALVASQPSYVLSSFPLRVLSVRRRNSAGIDVPMREMSRQEYFDTPSKTASPSIPIAYYFDPQTASATLYVWPAPDTTSAGEYSLQVTTLRRIDDMIASTDSLDMPQEWLDPVIWLLADDLETEYPVNDPRLAQKIEVKAAEAKAVLDYWDTESASIYMQPDFG